MRAVRDAGRGGYLQIVDLTEKADRLSVNSIMFIGKPDDEEASKHIGQDGLPHIGLYVERGTPVYRYVSPTSPLDHPGGGGGMSCI